MPNQPVFTLVMRSASAGSGDGAKRSRGSTGSKAFYDPETEEPISRATYYRRMRELAESPASAITVPPGSPSIQFLSHGEAAQAPTISASTANAAAMDVSFPFEESGFDPSPASPPAAASAWPVPFILPAESALCVHPGHVVSLSEPAAGPGATLTTSTPLLSHATAAPTVTTGGLASTALAASATEDASLLERNGFEAIPTGGAIAVPFNVPTPLYVPQHGVMTFSVTASGHMLTPTGAEHGQLQPATGSDDETHDALQVWAEHRSHWADEEEGDYGRASEDDGDGEVYGPLQEGGDGETDGDWLMDLTGDDQDSDPLPHTVTPETIAFTLQGPAAWDSGSSGPQAMPHGQHAAAVPPDLLILQPNHAPLTDVAHLSPAEQAGTNRVDNGCVCVCVCVCAHVITAMVTVCVCVCVYVCVCVCVCVYVCVRVS